MPSFLRLRKTAGIRPRQDRSGGPGDEQYKKELDEIKKNIKGDLKIKLKRDGKGDFYSWEISGKDAAEVLKANDVLAKKLGGVATAK